MTYPQTRIFYQVCSFYGYTKKLTQQKYKLNPAEQTRIQAYIHRVETRLVVLLITSQSQMIR